MSVSEGTTLSDHLSRLTGLPFRFLPRPSFSTPLPLSFFSPPVFSDLLGLKALLVFSPSTLNPFFSFLAVCLFCFSPPPPLIVQHPCHESLQAFLLYASPSFPLAVSCSRHILEACVFWVPWNLATLEFVPIFILPSSRLEPLLVSVSPRSSISWLFNFSLPYVVLPTLRSLIPLLCSLGFFWGSTETLPALPFFTFFFSIRPFWSFPSGACSKVPPPPQPLFFFF